MFATVQLLNGFAKELTYKIPEHLQQLSLEGMIVQVPLKKQLVRALVTQQLSTFQPTTFELKEIIKVDPFPDDQNYKNFIEKIAAWHFTKPISFYQRLQAILHTNESDPEAQDKLLAGARGEEPAEAIGRRLGVSNHGSAQNQQVTLTDEQQQVTDYLLPFIDQPSYAPTLLHGVTGSGKTEVYKKLIEHCIEQNKSVILLLPEVSLALQFQHFFEKNLATVTTIGFHSATAGQEKKQLWKALLDQKPMLIIGVHLPILLPMNNLGIIIVDEEHEGGFQEKKHPKINSKEIAIARAYTYKIPILLGSATPSLTSLHNAQTKNWKFFQLKHRFSGSFPTIKKVSLIEKNRQKRRFFWITKELEEAIRLCLAKKEQAIIYINRRGYSFSVQCKGCGFIFNCPHCSVSLTLHKNGPTGIEGLQCHYCGITKKLASFCPECKAPDTEFIKKGIGTQQIVQILKTLFPQASIERADLDSTKKKRSWQETVQLFHERKLDILVGTKTITKGYHFPGVTLVGIIWADLSLHFPHFSASESTLQQLIQVAGRAGRHHHSSNVIVQVMHDHDIFNYLNEQTYLTFTEHERAERKALDYPPFCRLVHLEISHTDEHQVEKDALQCAQLLQKIIEKNNLAITLLGPSQPLVHKINTIEMRQILIKAPSFALLHSLFIRLNLNAFTSNVFIVPQG